MQKSKNKQNLTFLEEVLVRAIVFQEVEHKFKTIFNYNPSIRTAFFDNHIEQPVESVFKSNYFLYVRVRLGKLN